MMEIWRDNGVFEFSEQRLVGQARAIIVNQWYTEVYLEEVRRETEREDIDMIMDRNDQQERKKLEGDQSESGIGDQETQTEARNDGENRIENANDNIEGLDLRENSVE